MMTGMQQLSLKLFGSFAASVSGKPLTQFRSDKTRALLAYLAMNGGRPFRRETLAALLWPEWPDNEARRNLRQTVHRLRQAFASEASDLSKDLLLTSRQTIQIDNSLLTLDATQFQQHLQTYEAHTHPRLEQCPSCLVHLQQAAELYRGEFMQGFGLKDAYPFDEWLYMQREQLQQQMLELLEQLAQAFEQKRDYKEAQLYANRQVLIAPWYESAHQRLMKLLMLQGQRSAALAQYESCRQLLEHELGVEPAAETKHLYRQIKEGNIEPNGSSQTAIYGFPTQLTPFIGRQQEIAQIISHLADPSCRILTLLGPGGMGKTRLSIRVGQELKAGGQYYRDGAYFIPLVTVSDEVMLISTLAQHLGLRLTGEGTAWQQLINYLRKKEILLVLDNFEQIADHAELLSDLIAQAPEIQIIVTSRQPLNLQTEWRQIVGGLDCSQGEESEAVRFFRRSARRSMPQFQMSGEDVSAVLALCRLVDGLPLALEIAASWTRMMDCSSILRETQKNLDFLTSPFDDLPERHQSLRAVLTQSWQQLSAHLQQALSQLAHFAGGFTLEAALAIVPELSLLDIATLLDRSLIQWLPNGRYQMHELLRQFAAGKEGIESTDFQQSYSQFYLTFLADQEGKLLGGEQKDGIETIQKEIDNIRLSWRWAIEQKNTNAIDRALNGLAAFYEFRGLYEEGHTRFADAISVAPYTELGHRLRMAEAVFRQKLGDLRGSERLINQVLDSGVKETRLAALIALARLYERSSQYDQAVSVLEESLDLAEPNSREAAQIWTILGAVHAYRGPMEERLAAHERALAINMALEDDLQTAECHVMLSMIHKDSGEYDHAIEHMEKALDIAERMNHRENIGRFKQKLGVIHWRKDDLESAQTYYEQALAVSREINHMRLITICLGSIGVLAKRRREYGSALNNYWQAVRLAEEMGDKATHAVYLGNIGNVYMDLGQYERAIEHLKQAADIDRSIGALGGVARHSGNIGDSLKFQGLYEHALPYFEGAIPHLREIGANYFLCWVLVSYAECLFEVGRISEAQKVNREGGYIAETIGRDYYHLMSLLLEERMRDDSADRQNLMERFQTLREKFPEPLMLAEIDLAYWQTTGEASAQQAAADRFMRLHEETKIMRYHPKAVSLR